MAGIDRRVVLTGVTALAAGTVAAALALRKPAAPDIHTPVVGAGDGAEQVPLQSLSAFVPVQPPKRLPDITITDAAGRAHKLAEFAGRPLLLNLWATWCAPCVAELPALAALARSVAGKDGLRVIAVSTDRGGAAVVQHYFATHGITGLEVWLDPKSEAADALALRGVPTTLLIGRHGLERARMEGPADWSSPAAAQEIAKLVG